MSKISFAKRVWVVKQYQNGISCAKIALAQKIHRSAVYQILDKYKEFGWDGLKDHKTGRPETQLNKNAEVIILDLRRRFGYGDGLETGDVMGHCLELMEQLGQTFDLRHQKK